MLSPSGPRAGSATGGVTSTYGSRTPTYGGQTPMYGSRTPMYGSQTPLHDGSRTPHYGSQTPLHEGSRTPSGAGGSAWDPSNANTPSRSVWGVCFVWAVSVGDLSLMSISR